MVRCADRAVHHRALGHEPRLRWPWAAAWRAGRRRDRGRPWQPPEGFDPRPNRPRASSRPTDSNRPTASNHPRAAGASGRLRAGRRAGRPGWLRSLEPAGRAVPRNRGVRGALPAAARRAPRALYDERSSPRRSWMRWTTVLTEQATDLVDAATIEAGGRRDLERSTPNDQRGRNAASPRRRRRGEHPLPRRVGAAAGRLRRRHRRVDGQDALDLVDHVPARRHRARRHAPRPRRVRRPAAAPRPGHRRRPSIFLTARDATDDRVRGLTSGGADYQVKPFAVAELVARVRLRLADAGTGAPTRLLRCADLDLDPDAPPGDARR